MGFRLGESEGPGIGVVMAEIVDAAELVIAWLRTFYVVPGFSLYLLMQLMIWATAGGVVLWFALDRFGTG